MPPAADANIEIQRLYAARTAAERKINKLYRQRYINLEPKIR